ncbi:selenium metabolism membrane protein YedE/FdhT [Mesobacillus maritimus]|uniref:selenium metabolism membrane protein YedE/FdhT n=1 Tax=Mesobacillus maritimus TaxID=1643336 RepID=UPI00203C537C|nr:selenium metabolism membrane protein YedE/FdhT [Mesobacillus maritimus]MCM3587327.1 selenium metabolism membrane protein YedE/FdhT [Mesobacillus maritimus]MCM3667892.1 selenium metabolism membrane protein YedE/FdhT [Mesobacillus maritimus]
MNWYQKIFKEYWNPYVAISLAGLISALYFGLTGTVWAVTGEFTRFGGHFLQWFGVNVSEWAYFDLVGIEGSPIGRTDGWIVIGMLVGALIMILLSNSFKIRVPNQKRRLVQGLIGGVIAGFGARLALGCNLAAFFTGVPQFSFHAWIFMVATAVGTYFGVKVVSTKWWLGKPNLKKGAGKVTLKRKQKKSNLQPILGLLVSCVYVGVIIYFFVTGSNLLAIGAIAGALFGILIERGQICFTSAFRDMWISGRAVMSKAIAVGMMVSVVLTFILIQTGSAQIIKIAAPSTVIGGLLFGFGIVLAGGCETGMMYRAMEGQILFWVVGVGNIIGATLLAYGWDHLGIFNALAKDWAAVNLIEEWGPTGALLGTLGMLALWFLFSSWWEKRFRYGSGITKQETQKLATKEV